MYLLSGLKDPDNIKDFIDFDTNVIPTPTWLEGRVFWDKDAHTIAIYDDIEGTALQVGQEIRIRVYNNGNDTIPVGSVVTVSGVTAEGIVEVVLAISSDKHSAECTIGIASYDIVTDSYGWAIMVGIIDDIDTSAYTEMDVLWLSETVAGSFQNTRPRSPSYEVRAGLIVVSHVTEGKIFAEFRVLNNDRDNAEFFNGSVLEPTEVIIVSNGTTVNCALNSLAANGKLSLMFDQEYVSVADGIAIDLTLGTATVPIENFVYIDSAGDIQISTSGFPTGIQYVPIIKVMCPSAAIAQSYGVYKAHAYTDHLTDSVYQGHLSHLNAWIRKRPASWQNGIVLTQSVSEGTPVADIQLSYTSGLISQLHDHTFPAYDTSTKPGFLINHNTTPYEVANGLTPAMDEDSKGISIGNNKYYDLVIWGVISEETKDCKLFFNLPDRSYVNLADAVNDVKNSSNYNIPPEYVGTGFLITRLVIQRTTTTVEVVPSGTRDLRGIISAGGGSILGPSGITIFDHLTDTPITKVGESLKSLRVNLGETELEYFIIPSKYTETPTGTINGTNKVFSVTKIFIAESASVFLNGLKQRIGVSNDYVEDAGLQSITFEVAPKNIGFTDTIEVMYESIQ